MKRPLVIGYGNPVRQDDGIGPRAAELLRSWLPPGTVDVVGCHQLTPELAVKIADALMVVFFDAALDLPPDQVACLPVEPSSWSAASHHLSPGELVGLAEQIGGAAPQVFLITGGAGQTGLAEGLTAAGERTAARMAALGEWLLLERTSAQVFLRTPVAAGH